LPKNKIHRKARKEELIYSKNLTTYKFDDINFVHGFGEGHLQ